MSRWLWQNQGHSFVRQLPSALIWSSVLSVVSPFQESQLNLQASFRLKASLIAHAGIDFRAINLLSHELTLSNSTMVMGTAEGTALWSPRSWGFRYYSKVSGEDSLSALVFSCNLSALLYKPLNSPYERGQIMPYQTVACYSNIRVWYLRKIGAHCPHWGRWGKKRLKDMKKLF